MTAFIAVNYSAPVSSVAATITAGQCLVSSGTAGFVVASSANRTTYGKADGIAVTSGDTRNPVIMIVIGPVPASATGLGSGAAGPIRVSSAGVLERVATPTSSDEVVGYCETDGRAHVAFGVLTHRVYVDSGGGGGTPGGSSGDLQTNNAGSFGGLSPGTSGNLCTSNGSAWTSTAPSFAASVIASGTFAHERGGLEADVSAYDGLVRIASGTTSAVSLPLSAANGGTGQDTSGATGIAKVTAGTWSTVSAPTGTIVGTSDTQTLTNKTLTSPVLTTPQINDTSADHQYVFAVSELAADRTVTLPLLAGDDTFVFAAFAQTLTNKTINTADNTLTTTSAAAGDILYHNGTKYVRLGIGTAGQVLKTNGGETAPEWGAAGGGTPGGASGDIQTNDGAGGFGSITPGTGVSTFLATPSGANLGSALTSALPVTAGGTGATASTGSGNVVLATAPTIASPILSGVLRLSTFATNNGTGTLNDQTRSSSAVVEFTNATGPTVTGFDSTGANDGTLLYVYAAAATVAFTHEDAGSTASNRIELQGGITINLPEGCWTAFIYRSSRWHHLAGTAI